MTVPALASASGLLQVASLLGLLLLLLKAAQLYLHRQWLLKALQQFPSPPSHWLYGHSREVGKRGPGSGRAGRAGHSRSMVTASKSKGQSFVFVSRWPHVRSQLTSQVVAPHPSPGSSLAHRTLGWCPRLCHTLLPSVHLQAVPAALPFEDNGSSFLSYPSPGSAASALLTEQSSRGFPAPGVPCRTLCLELAWEPRPLSEGSRPLPHCPWRQQTAI